MAVSILCDIHLSDLFKYELSPVPPSLVDEYGDMRKASKAKLDHKVYGFGDIQLEPIDSELIDGNEAIYHTLWSKHINIDAFTNNRAHQTYIIFNRYDVDLIKSHEQHKRAKYCVPRQCVHICNAFFS